ncbi:COP23 domain-containing protein [Nostocaceae cyanobacterium CENA369]|uniref:COP23 domain-containing protein n=1 Tax=Dendronalium phyllosphericum CENA369 TaxID=1725256 RepID=A0A8J7LHE2_9NOST|nr:COP23 domain-containing protein [Dendronalium phyllosphericum]MBH8576103.1 COP23 domain-containing protein [Dendronalium phyllosphericum CENA369]
MKPRLFLQVLTASVIAIGGIATIMPPSFAEAKTYFCERNNGVWTTFAKNYNNQKIPVIRWVKTLGNYTPQSRCQAVSSRFQSAYEKGVLNYLTSGISGNQAVICAASQYGGPCSQLLFTLKSPRDASSVLQNLVEIGYKARGPILQSEDASSQIYIDMSKLLSEKATQTEN